MALVFGQSGVGGHATEQTSRQRRIDALEELQEDDADRVALGAESIAPGVRHFLNEALARSLERS